MHEELYRDVARIYLDAYQRQRQAAADIERWRNAYPAIYRKWKARSEQRERGLQKMRDDVIDHMASHLGSAWRADELLRTWELDRRTLIYRQ